MQTATRAGTLLVTFCLLNLQDRCSSMLVARLQVEAAEETAQESQQECKVAQQQTSRLRDEMQQLSTMHESLKRQLTEANETLDAKEVQIAKTREVLLTFSCNFVPNLPDSCRIRITSAIPVGNCCPGSSMHS
jgi:septal ring factor EnvC (AmiA/AmiB activator)